MPQIDKGTRIWEVLKKDFEKRFLEKDGVRHALARLVKSGVDRDRLLKGLMHTVAHIEALRDILPEARIHEKRRRRRSNDLAPSILDTAQRLEEANLYYNLSTLLGRDIAGLVDKLRAISPEVESLQKNGPLSASSARSGPHGPTTASIRETFIESIRPEPEPKHFNTDIETLLHALSEWTGVDLEVTADALRKLHSRRKKS